MPLKIIIIGAGVAGLSAAIALRQQGHAVTLLEKSAFHQEAGAAIHVSPNATGLLKRLGLDTKAHGGNACVGFARYHGGSGEVKYRVDIRQLLPEGNEYPFDLIHRADLHDALKRLAGDEGLDGPLPELILGCRVQDVDITNATVTLTDGRTFHGDLIIGADGAHSFCRKKLDSAIEPFPYGKSCYRWLVPRSVLQADPKIAPLIDPNGWFEEISEGSHSIIMYPCRDNTAMNIAAFVPNHEVGEAGCNASGSRDQLVKSFDHMCPAARKIVALAPADVKVWVLYDMQALPSWTRERLVLIGDAAHPFLPFLGQGGAMAIEDAVCIARLLPANTSASEVEERMKLYEDIRYERAEYVREQTRRNGLDEEERALDVFAMLKYCYQHDEWRNTEEVLGARPGGE